MRSQGMPEGIEHVLEAGLSRGTPCPSDVLAIKDTPKKLFFSCLRAIWGVDLQSCHYVTSFMINPKYQMFSCFNLHSNYIKQKALR